MNEVLFLFLEITKYLIPALIVFVITYYQFKVFFDTEYQKRSLDLKQEQQRIMQPLKLQAYERLVLLMERMSPESLVLRVHRAGISATQMKSDLINDINNEFSHNLSQQLYVSPQAWQVIRVVKEEMVNLINTAYAELGPNAVGIDLSKAIFNKAVEMEMLPTQKALNFIKREFDLVFN
jgi:heme/copper-type cytochrome/quinol oxidase subunit 2